MNHFPILLSFNRELRQMPSLLPLFNHFCHRSSHSAQHRAEKCYTPSKTNGKKVRDLWLVFTCAFLSWRERVKWVMASILQAKECKRGISLWYKFGNRVWVLQRKAVGQCFHRFFTISEITVVLLVVVSLTAWWIFFYLCFTLFFLCVCVSVLLM